MSETKSRKKHHGGVGRRVSQAINSVARKIAITDPVIWYNGDGGGSNQAINQPTNQPTNQSIINQSSTNHRSTNHPMNQSSCLWTKKNKRADGKKREWGPHRLAKTTLRRCYMIPTYNDHTGQRRRRNKGKTRQKSIEQWRRKKQWNAKKKWNANQYSETPKNEMSTIWNGIIHPSKNNRSTNQKGRAKLPLALLTFDIKVNVFFPH